MSKHGIVAASFVLLGCCCPEPSCAGPVSALLPVLAQDLAHEQMAARRQQNGVGPALATCFADGTSDSVIALFQTGNARFQNFSRWGATAYSPSGSQNGQPLTISYSIVPDGTQIDGFNGEASAPSNLRAFLTGIHGSQAAWLSHVHSTFDRWSKVCGVKYVYEPNDDGAPFAGAVGVPGVRGDCRIGGHRIDGNGNVLAYNFFPDANDFGFAGDMVIDTGDNFFNNLASNAILLRNVLAHEHGHGLGMSHVCPIQSTRLMEPIIATNFSGPRHDEVRHAQYLYGDLFEPNDDALLAADLGDLGACNGIAIGDQSVVSALNPGALNSIPYSSPVSLGIEGDQDWFSFTIDAPRRIDIRLSPAGHPYDNAFQSCGGQASCCSGDIDNSEQQWDIAFDLIGPDGEAVIASANGTSLGGAEFANNVMLSGPGTYFVRVRGNYYFFASQMYSLEITPRPAAVDAMVLHGGSLSLLPGASVAIDVHAAPGVEDVDLSASRLYSRRGNESSFTPTALARLSEFDLRAVLFDVPCSTQLYYYVEIVGTAGTVTRLPCDAPTSVYAPFIGSRTVMLDDDFEVNRGWTVGPDSATSGAWVRDIPVGTQAQPTRGHSLAGSRCFFTGNGLPGEAPGASDVDGGFTQLISPLLDLASFSDVEVSYWRWFSNGTSSGAYGDAAQFDVNPNNTAGFFWKRAETVGPGGALDTDVNGGWRFSSFRFSSIPVVPSATTRLRYYVIDGLEASIVEGALDDVLVVGLSCQTVNTCVGDLDGSDAVDDLDFSVFVNSYNDLLCPDALADATCTGDFTRDGLVDDADFSVFVVAYNAIVCP